MNDAKYLENLQQTVRQISDHYARAYHFTRDDDWYVLKLQEELGELIQSYLMCTKRARHKDKSEGEIQKVFAHEVVDVFGHILLLADHFHIDLHQAFKDKWLSHLSKSP